VEVARAGFRFICYFLLVLAPLWVLMVKLVSPVQTHFSFFYKAGSYGLLSKKKKHSCSMGNLIVTNAIPLPPCGVEIRVKCPRFEPRNDRLTAPTLHTLQSRDHPGIACPNLRAYANNQNTA
jgi:hypothetical protein